jgi:GT2 family glycosyltransferase
VSSGNKDYLSSLLDSIRKQTYSFLETIIIYDSSNHNLKSNFNQKYPEIKFLPIEKLLTYSVCLNKGIDISHGSFILCLNDDVILDKRFIEEALRGFDINNTIGMVSGKILRFDQQTIDSTGLFLSFFRTAKERGYGKTDKGQFEKKGYIFGVNGAVAFYSRKMLDLIRLNEEYFDSDFRFFYEDLDLAWRAQNFGWKGYYIPTAIAYHLRGGTARNSNGINKRFARRFISDELHFDLIKNRYLALIKNESLLCFIVFLPLIILYDIIVWLYILFLRPKVIGIFLCNRIPINSAFRKRLKFKRIKREVGRVFVITDRPSPGLSKGSIH